MRETPTIQLLCGDWESTLVSERPAELAHLDPPWDYDNAKAKVQGRSSRYYAGLPDVEIARHAASMVEYTTPDAYMVVWCTFPKLEHWMSQYHMLKKAGWRYITGGTWGKINGLGAGFHVRGDAELVLIYRKKDGHPKAQTTQSNHWLDRRVGHSEKPQNILKDLIGLCTAPGDLVIDPYAGASASMARACRATGRAYLGAELDPLRHAQALRRLELEEQPSLFNMDDLLETKEYEAAMAEMDNVQYIQTTLKEVGTEDE